MFANKNVKQRQETEDSYAMQPGGKKIIKTPDQDEVVDTAWKTVTKLLDMNLVPRTGWMDVLERQASSLSSSSTNSSRSAVSTSSSTKRPTQTGRDRSASSHCASRIPLPQSSPRQSRSVGGYSSDTDMDEMMIPSYDVTYRRIKSNPTDEYRMYRSGSGDRGRLR